MQVDYLMLRSLMSITDLVISIFYAYNVLVVPLAIYVEGGT